MPLINRSIKMHRNKGAIKGANETGKTKKEANKTMLESV